MAEAGKQRLELRQKQTLSMTTELRQAIALLQMSSLELQIFVDQEIETNPLLDYDENSIMEGPADPSSQSDAGSEWQNILPEHQSLHMHLSGQIQSSPWSDAEKSMGMYLTDLLDLRGFVTQSLQEISESSDYGIADLEAVLVKLQALEPTGVYARNLSECLALQLKEKNRLDPLMQRFLDCLALAQQGNRQALAHVCECSMEDVGQMLEELRGLCYDPGETFYREDNLTLTQQPDVIVRAADRSDDMQDEGWVIELNHERLPKVLMNNEYAGFVSQSATSKADEAYVKTCHHRAQWLVNALDQRARTLLQVAKVIVDKQKPFFQKGLHYLLPMTTRDVAENADCHESTVSRVTQNKIIETPHGVIDFKTFFSASIGGEVGAQTYAAQAIKQKIKELIENEGRETLSDEQIATILSKMNIKISRRTVAKYREAVGIQTSFERKKKLIL